MRTSVHTCRPSDDVLTALSPMTGRRVRRLPVVDDAGRLVGIVSLNDAVLPAGAGRNAVRPGAVLDAFKAVCAHPIPVPMSEPAEKTGASENSVSRAVGCSANRLLIATPCCGIRRALARRLRSRSWRPRKDQDTRDDHLHANGDSQDDINRCYCIRHRSHCNVT
jgi:hypothetical protein